MSIIDAKLNFGDLNLASGHSTLASGLIGNIVDFGAAGKDGWGNSLTESPGEGQSLYFHVNVNTVVGGEAGWVKLCHGSGHNSTDLTSNVTVMATIVLASALAVGNHISVSIPMGGAARYFQVSAGDTSTTGKVDCWISDSPFDSEVTLK